MESAPSQPVDPILIVLTIWALLGWLGAVVFAIRMLGHKLHGRSLLWYLFNGWAFFVSGTFAPSAAPDQRGFIWAATLFMLSILCTAIYAIYQTGLP